MLNTMPSQHLSDGQIENFRNGSLESADLLEVSEHLAACPECQIRAGSANTLSSGVAYLQQIFERHLTEEEVIAFCDEGQTTKDASVRNHLEHCQSCREEVRDLAAFRAKIKPPSAG